MTGQAQTGGIGPDRISWSEIGLWGLAGLVVLSAHVAAAAIAMHQAPEPAAQGAPPPAIMMELADEPEAIRIDASEVAPDQQSSEAAEPAETVKTQETLEETPLETPKAETVEPLEAQEVAEAEPVALEPVEEVVEETDPLEEQIVAELDKVEVPLPLARPQPPRPEPEPEPEPAQPKAQKPVAKAQKPVEKPRRKQASQAQPQMEAKAEVKQGQRNAARQSSSGLFSPTLTPAKWQSRLMAHLERRKRYPSGARSRREQGIAYVRFRIDDAGNVVSASLLRSSGFAELDREVVDLVHRASPVPAPPPGVNKTITAPVQFSVR